MGSILVLPYINGISNIIMIWLSPIYPSPQNDNGYDVANYTAINPMFGTMTDFENLMATAKEHGIEIMLDMVFNHVSTDHEWFQKALAGDKKYQDYFILRDEPTDWVSKFGGNAWAPFGDTDKYYLHLFDKTQADLNWRNPEVREELFEVLRFWMDKGVKGFRFDVINLIGKDEVLNDCAENDGKPAYTDRPITHDYIHMMNQATFGKEDGLITVGEMSFTSVENCILYTNLIGSTLEHQTLKGGISRSAPCRLASTLQSLPPILHIKAQCSVSSYSKGSRGLSVLPRVHCIFTASSISLSLGWRQPGHHYAIRAGRNLPDKEFRYLRTVIVTAAVYRGPCDGRSACSNYQNTGERL